MGPRERRAPRRTSDHGLPKANNGTRGCACATPPQTTHVGYKSAFVLCVVCQGSPVFHRMDDRRKIRAPGHRLDIVPAGFCADPVLDDASAHLGDTSEASLAGSSQQEGGSPWPVRSPVLRALGQNCTLKARIRGTSRALPAPSPGKKGDPEGPPNQLTTSHAAFLDQIRSRIHELSHRNPSAECSSSAEFGSTRPMCALPNGLANIWPPRVRLTPSPRKAGVDGAR